MKRRQQSGFTLLEIIIALTLATAAALLAASVLKTGTDFWQRAREFNRQQDEVRGAMRVLRTELGSGSEFGGTSYEIQYLTTAYPTGAARVGRVKVKLICEDDGENHVRLIHRYIPLLLVAPGMGSTASSTVSAASTQPAEVVEDVPEDEVLINNLTECEFNFLGMKEGAKVAEWMQDWPEGPFPMAIRLWLGTEQGRLPPNVFVKR